MHRRRPEVVALESRLLLVADLTSTTLAASAPVISTGGSLTLTATVRDLTTTSATPSGTVTFIDNGVALGNAQLTNGTATLTTTTLPSGTNSFSATFLGTSAYAPSSFGYTPAGNIRTVAGIGGQSGSSGEGGPATQAPLNLPYAVATDAAGNLFIADIEVVREVTTDGTIRTVAGIVGQNGTPTEGGVANQQPIGQPTGLAVDSQGDLFIADFNAGVVREVTPDGTIHTYAGTTGQFGQPHGLALDPAGNLYVADPTHDVIWKVAPDRTVSIFAGMTGQAGASGDTGQATAAAIGNPFGVATDAAGNVYIADPTNKQVRKVALGGIISTVAGGPGQLNPGQATALTTDAAGNLFIANNNQSKVLELLTNGTSRTVAGTGSFGSAGDGGPATQAQITDLYGIAVDAAGDLFLPDYESRVVREVGAGVNVAVGTSYLAFSGLPTTATTDSKYFSFTVTAYRADGVIDSGNNDAIDVTSTDPHIFGTLPRTLSQGSLSAGTGFATPGSQTITATDASNPALHVTSAAITVTPGPVDHYVITHTAATGGDRAGTALSFTVTARDIFNNTATGDIEGFTVVDSDGKATVAPATGNVNAGTVTITVTPQAAGSHVLTFTGIGSQRTSTLLYTVAAGLTRHLVLGGLPTTVTAGVSTPVTITAEDQFGNVATDDASGFTLSSSTDSRFAPVTGLLAKGTATANVVFTTAGPQSLAAATLDGSETGTTTGITVSPAAATRFVVTAAATATAGTPFQVTVTALDAYGNVDTAFAGPVNLASSDGRAVLPSDPSLTNGTGTFTVTLVTAGNQTITAFTIAPAFSSALSGSTGPIAVTPGAATHLALTPAPIGVTAGQAVPITIAAEDAYGNIATAFTGIVTLTSTDARASTTDATLRNGTAVVAVTFRTAGNQTVTATDARSNPTLTGSTGPIAVSPAAAALLVVTPAATTATAGAAFRVTVTAQDAYGNVDTGFSGPVALSSTDGRAVLPADAALAAGTGTFTVTLDTAGDQTIAAITAAPNTSPTLTGSTDTIAVAPGAPARISLTGPTAATAGQAASFTATAYDAYGNVATAADDPIRVTSTDPAATLPASVALQGGTATFGVTFATAGGQTVTVAGTANSSLTGSAKTTVVAAPITIRGTVFLDSNINGRQDLGEVGLANRVVYLDLNGNGSEDAGEPTATTDSTGAFTFANAPATAATTVREALGRDASGNDAVGQTVVNPDGTVAVGVVLISPLAPLPVVPGLTPGTPGTDATTAYVAALYRTVLGRQGSAEEINGWLAPMQAGLGRLAVANLFINSPEHRRDEVAAYYQRFLGRAADATSSFWVDQFEGGATEAQVVQGFLNSPEYQANHASDDAFIAGLSTDVLRQQATPADQASRAIQLQATSRAALAASVVASPDAIDQVIDSFYQVFLHRQLELGATSAAWADLLTTGAASISDVAGAILASDEFLQDALAGGV